MIGWLVNNEFDRMWKEAANILFKVLPRCLYAEAELNN
jgi:hypothetical protein